VPAGFVAGVDLARVGAAHLARPLCREVCTAAGAAEPGRGVGRHGGRRRRRPAPTAAATPERGHGLSVPPETADAGSRGGCPAGPPLRRLPAVHGVGRLAGQPSADRSALRRGLRTS
jgi:hypothetical protein